MKDAFDKMNLRDTIKEFRDYLGKQNRDLSLVNDNDLDLLDKVYEYLIELELYYEGEQ